LLERQLLSWSAGWLPPIDLMSAVVRGVIEQRLRKFGEKHHLNWWGSNIKTQWLLGWREGEIKRQVQVRLDGWGGNYHIVVAGIAIKPEEDDSTIEELKGYHEEIVYDGVIYEIDAEGHPHYHKNKVIEATKKLSTAYDKAKNL